MYWERMDGKSRGAVLLLLTLLSISAAIVHAWGDAVKGERGYRDGKEEESRKLGEVRDDNEDDGVMPELICIFVVFVVIVLASMIVSGLVYFCRHKKMCCFSRRNPANGADTPSSNQPATCTPMAVFGSHQCSHQCTVDVYPNPAASGYLFQSSEISSQSANITTMHVVVT